ncbi:MAG TPA: hypothetical protein VGQ20_15430 [Acidimicrobiales bacterium]|nr:hypothetical protein [Acidimicrobiales bacterium]
MRVSFFVRNERKHISGWTAVRGKRTVVPGPWHCYGGAGGVPHDLVQYVIEAATKYEHGFWGLVARGATFKSTGRKRTVPGRALIAAHRDELSGAERLAGAHVSAWKAGADTHVTRCLEHASQQWHGLGAGEIMEFEWPSPTGHVERWIGEAVG